MTGATELLRQLIGAHPAGIEDTFVLKLLCLHRRDMIDSRTMAGFTGYSGNQSIQLQLITVGGAGSMAGKTMACLVYADCASGRFVERRRHITRITDREIKCSDVPVKTQVAFIERSVVSKNISLTGLALTERIENRLRDCILAIRNGVEGLVAAPHNFVAVRSRAKREPRMGAKYFAGGHRFKGPAHCRCVLVRFFLMTLDTGLWAGVFRVSVSRTPRCGHRYLTAAHARPLGSRS